MKLGLVVLNGIHKGRHIPLAAPTFLIGRARHCHLRPVRDDVGREHCAVIQRGGAVYLRDFGSTNGTVLNRSAVVRGNEVQITHRDVFDVGPLQFQLTMRPMPAPIVVPPPPQDFSGFKLDQIFGDDPAQEPHLDDTIQMSDPMLAAVTKPLSDAGERLS